MIYPYILWYFYLIKKNFFSLINEKNLKKGLIVVEIFRLIKHTIRCFLHKQKKTDGEIFTLIKANDETFIIIYKDLQVKKLRIR